MDRAVAHHGCHAIPAFEPTPTDQWQGRPSELDGSWVNMDSPSERYYIDGLRVTRVDDRGARDFSIHWDQYKQQWQWGMHGRLALHWLADDKIAWVPEGVRESPFNHRVWRWQRWGQPLQHSQSQPNRARIVPPAPANAEGRHPPNHYGPVSGRASVRSLSVVAPYQQQQQQQQHGRQQPQDWNHYNPSVPYRQQEHRRSYSSRRDSGSSSSSHGSSQNHHYHHHHHHSHHQQQQQYHHNGGSGSGGYGGRHYNCGPGGGGGSRTRWSSVPAMHPNEHLPCGLTVSEVCSLLTRDIRPEDYDLLLRLDETVKRPTASAESVKDLPQVSAKEFWGNECSVCLSAFVASDSVVALPCRHQFHSSCIKKWLTECRKTCPLCGAPFSA
mmetsp:Transcript_47628/g.102660  ORF Transcript_47628/g.102660 Transcript_47628/m.102660 type:complete len:384 (-) Transcript_47628:250-1401(-)